MAEPTGGDKRYERRDADTRREEILAAMRELAAQGGVVDLSISAVTKRVGCTRSLFYHYFSSKEEALDAALDQIIDGFVDRLRAWNAGRVHGDIEGSLDSVVALIKELVLEDQGLPKAFDTHGDAALYTGFVHRVADRAAAYIVDSTVQDFARFHSVRIDHVYETFYVLITGLVNFVRLHPATDDATLKDIIASTLHIEGYTAKYAERRRDE